MIGIAAIKRMMRSYDYPWNCITISIRLFQILFDIISLIYQTALSKKNLSSRILNYFREFLPPFCVKISEVEIIIIKQNMYWANIETVVMWISGLSHIFISK